MRIWIDLTNSPHVLVMRPVIERLRADGHEVRVTARDFAQTIELCERFGIAHTAIGHHRGERLGAKALGLASRSAALVRWARADARAAGARFDLALGHGSNDVSVAAALLRIPSATMFDYEWATVQHNVNCRLARAVVVPDAIPPQRLERYGARGQGARVRGPEGGVLPGGLRARRRRARRARPRPRPPDRRRAHPAGGLAVPPLRERPVRAGARAAARRPRPSRGAAGRAAAACDSQREELRGVPGFVVPEHAIDAQSLIAFADLVISAGGTMNREAVALGTPVYTTFEGRLGAVDERLIAEGRLRKLLDRGRARAGQARARASAAARVRRDPRRAGRAAAFARRWAARHRTCGYAAVVVGAYNLSNAPTDPLGGPSPPPPLAAPARGGRGAGRARVLPRLPAALRQRARPASTRSCAKRTIWWVLRRQPAGARALARLPAPLALRGPARLRGGRARGGRDRAADASSAIEVLRPVHRYPHGNTVAVVLPNGVIVLFALLSLAVPGRRARARAQRVRAPPAGGLSRCAQGRAHRADRRRRRRRAAGAARDHAQPRARAGAGRLPRRRPAQARPADRRRARARQHRRRPAAHPRRGRARRSDHRDPLRAGIDARADRARVPRARHPGAHAADRVRAAADARRARPAGARGARRGRARPRAGAHGARARRRLPGRARPCS